MKRFLTTIILGLIILSCNKIECKETNCSGAVTMDYRPVCGCNNITYPNSSAAECHGITDYKNVECDNN